jgi:hypothetical protein
MIALVALLAPLALAPQGEQARTLDTVHLFEPPARLEEWKQRRFELYVQVLVAAGLWPLRSSFPEPTLRGPVERDGYVVWKLSFASMPGHYVTGNLYEPKGDVKAGVLSPHGHWDGGRFSELANEEGNDRWPIQARCAQLARMGCVVLNYDMVGYGDSTAIPHEALADADAILDGASLMGLHLWNSLCAFHVLRARHGVRRVGMTGASGGGTQTFLTCAVGEWIDAAFPAVMVSNRMQGGCACENAPYLRLGTDNVELAALFAPRPLALSGANDWTVAIETEGLPELKKLWGLYGAANQVTARCWPELPHNFGHESRAMMYAWFNEHLELGAGEIVEAPIVPLTRAEMSVFDAEHPRPQDEGGVEAVRAWWRGAIEWRNTRDGFTGAWEIEEMRYRALAALMAPGQRASKTDETVVFVTGPDGDAEYERAWKRLEELSPFQVRRIVLPEGPAPRDEARHRAYAGYSWCYNPPDLLRRARSLAAQVASVRDARLLAIGAEARAAALAIPGQLCFGGRLSRAALVSPDWFVPRTDLEDRDFLPCERGLGGMAALLSSAFPYAHDGSFQTSKVVPQVRLVGAEPAPIVFSRPLTDEELVTRQPELDDALLRWLAER